MWCVFVHVQEAIQLDGDVLFGLVKRTYPAIYKHLVSLWILLPVNLIWIWLPGDIFCFLFSVH